MSKYYCNPLPYFFSPAFISRARVFAVLFVYAMMTDSIYVLRFEIRITDCFRFGCIREKTKSRLVL
jgi:hypothetical protein